MIDQIIKQRYRIKREIGRGGMGEVYEAEDFNLNRTVAIKIMRSSLAEQERFRQRFQQEAQLAAQLNHPNIVTVLDFGVEGRQMFLVMEYVPISLRGYLKELYRNQRKTIELAEAADLVKQIADALHYAHQQGMIHSDIKPDNILLKPLSSGGQYTAFRALLTDFGLAKLVQGNTMSIKGQAAEGTYAYMSPEQFRGGEITPQSDIYSLGVMLYELATGRQPFQPEPRSLKEAYEAHVNIIPPRPSDIRRGIPPKLEEIILKCMAKDPRERLKTADTVAKALRVFQDMTPAAQSKPASAPALLNPDSLNSYVMRQSGFSQMPSQMPVYTPVAPLPSDAALDRLIVYAPKDQQPEPRIIEIYQDKLRIGREPDNDVPITDVKASRYHAQIRRGEDGYYLIEDLGSTNGTWLEKTRLKPNQPRLWMPDMKVRIGYTVFEMQYKRQISPSKRNTQQPTMRHSQAVPMTFEAAGMTTDRIAVTFAPEVVALEAGGRGSATLEITSQSSNVEHVQIHVIDLPTGWYSVSAEELKLLPNEKGSVTISFFPPRKSSSFAGEHHFTVRVTVENSTQAARVPARLKIAPFYGFEAELQPQRLQRWGRAALKLTNTGNIEDTYSISGRDREGLLLFSIYDSPARIHAGQSELLPLRVQTRLRHWFGMTRTYPFELLITSAQPDAKPVPQPGELLSPPILPTCAIAALTLLLMACIGATILGLSLLGASGARREALASAVAQTRVAEVTQGAGQFFGTATSDRVSNDELATQAANQQATQAGQMNSTQAANDDDMDGLTNQREAELGTNPRDPDTDKDGIIDGQEVLVHNTNPLLPDTDGDGLLDGVEIRMGTLPTKDDTDGDGLLDGVDPEPLVPRGPPTQPAAATAVCSSTIIGGPFTGTVAANLARVYLGPAISDPLVTAVERNRVVRVRGRSADAVWLRLDTPETRWIPSGTVMLNGNLCDLPDRSSERGSGTTGGVISYGQTQNNSILDEYGHSWSFFSNPGSLVHIELSSNFDNDLLLFDPQGSFAAQNDGNLLSIIDYTVTTAGEQVIIVRGTFGATGAYSISLQLTGGPG